MNIEEFEIQYVKSSSNETTAVLIPYQQWFRFQDEYSKLKK